MMLLITIILCHALYEDIWIQKGMYTWHEDMRILSINGMIGNSLALEDRQAFQAGIPPEHEETF